MNWWTEKIIGRLCWGGARSLPDWTASEKRRDVLFWGLFGWSEPLKKEWEPDNPGCRARGVWGLGSKVLSLTYTNTLRSTNEKATACVVLRFWLIGVSHAERWKAFLITVPVADLQKHTHTRQWNNPGGGDNADNERERGRDLSQAFSPPISPRTRALPNTPPHNTHSLLLWSWNAPTSSSHNSVWAFTVCTCCVWERVCAATHPHVCLESCSASVSREGKGNVIPRHKRTNCAKSSPYPIL